MPRIRKNKIRSAEGAPSPRRRPSVTDHHTVASTRWGRLNRMLAGNKFRREGGKTNKYTWKKTGKKMIIKRTVGHTGNVCRQIEPMFASGATCFVNYSAVERAIGTLLFFFSVFQSRFPSFPIRALSYYDCRRERVCVNVLYLTQRELGTMAVKALAYQCDCMVGDRLQERCSPIDFVLFCFVVSLFRFVSVRNDDDHW